MHNLLSKTLSSLAGAKQILLETAERRRCKQMVQNRAEGAAVVKVMPLDFRSSSGRRPTYGRSHRLGELPNTECCLFSIPQRVVLRGHNVSQS